MLVPGCKCNFSLGRPFDSSTLGYSVKMAVVIHTVRGRKIRGSLKTLGLMAPLEGHQIEHLKRFMTKAFSLINGSFRGGSTLWGSFSSQLPQEAACSQAMNEHKTPTDALHQVEGPKK